MHRVPFNDPEAGAVRAGIDAVSAAGGAVAAGIQQVLRDAWGPANNLPEARRIPAPQNDVNAAEIGPPRDAARTNDLLRPRPQPHDVVPTRELNQIRPAPELPALPGLSLILDDGSTAPHDVARSRSYIQEHYFPNNDHSVAQRAAQAILGNRCGWTDVAQHLLNSTNPQQDVAMLNSILAPDGTIKYDKQSGFAIHSPLFGAEGPARIDPETGRISFANLPGELSPERNQHQAQQALERLSARVTTRMASLEHGAQTLADLIRTGRLNVATLEELLSRAAGANQQPSDQGGAHAAITQGEQQTIDAINRLLRGSGFSLVCQAHGDGLVSNRRRTVSVYRQVNGENVLASSPIRFSLAPSTFNQPQDSAQDGLQLL